MLLALGCTGCHSWKDLLVHIVGLRQVQQLPDSFCCGAMHGAKLVHSLASSVFVFTHSWLKVFTYEDKDLDTPT